MTQLSWQPSKQILEDAARAGGRRITGRYENPLTSVIDVYVDDHLWQPHLPTSIGKADLLDLMLATTLSHRDLGAYIEVFSLDSLDFNKLIAVKDGDKHAALARAVIEVAAKVGAKMRKSEKTTVDNLLEGRSKIPLKAEDIGRPSFSQDMKGGV